MAHKILFISHEASRTGAPIVFLHLLRWLKANTDIEITILIKKGGELDNDFSEVAPVLYWYPPFRILNFRFRVMNRLLRVFKYDYYRNALLRKLEAKKFDLIYSNTVDAHDILPLLRSIIKSPVISHVHENEFSIKCYYPQSLSKAFTDSIDHFIAVSQTTKNNLTDNFGISSDKVSIYYEFVPVKKLKSPSKDKSIIRKELGLQDEFIVGASGSVNWRKGIDLFLSLVIKVRQLKPGFPIKFIWVGHNDFSYNAGFEYELNRIPILKDIIFTGAKPNPEDYFQIFDVFSLTSREDPFPLVCLEAGALGKPILCFENSGGIPELVSKGGGFIVPYSDIDAMALRVIELYENKDLLVQKASEIADLVYNYDVDVIAPQILQKMKSIIKSLY